MEKIQDLTIGDLLNKGASASIYFHRCRNEQDARDKLSAYSELGKVVAGEREGTAWVEIRVKSIHVTAFYQSEEE